MAGRSTTPCGTSPVVVTYLAQHPDNPKLLDCPWCYLRGVFLPELPPPPAKPKSAFERAAGRGVAIMTDGRAGAVSPIPDSHPSGVTNSAKGAPAWQKLEGAARKVSHA
jgi:hypothetical protein